MYHSQKISMVVHSS